MAAHHFDVSVTDARPLPSDRDQNFLLVAPEAGRRYVLKIAQSQEDPAALDFQNQMLEHLARAGFPLPKVLFTSGREARVTVQDRSGSVFLARLLTWVPGVQLCRVKPPGPALLRNLGSFLGAMDRALEDFSHPAQDRSLDWDLQRAGEVVESVLPEVEDSTRRGLLDRMTRRFLAQLSPLASELRLSVIHGDANDHNVLVGEPSNGDDPDSRRVTGLVDFGDAGRSFTVGEVAIAGAYLMMGRGDPFSVAARLVEGYHRALPLREGEIAATFPLMGLRLCTSVAMSAHQKRLEPHDPYLTVSEEPAWELLDRLEGEILEIPPLLLRDACGLDPVPASARVAAWLKSHGTEASPVVGTVPGGDGQGPGERAPEPLDLSTTPLHIFDLSQESLEFQEAPAMEEVDAWTTLLFHRMREVGAAVGVGRYDEVRRLYTSELFRTPGDDPPEWRTVHMGVDLFVDPGSPVLAPFDAVVHSVRDNRHRLDYGATVVLEHEGPEESGGSPRFWTLYGHLAQSVLTGIVQGQRLKKGETFAEVGDATVNGGWPPHLHFQIITHILGFDGDYPGVALPSQRALWKLLSPDPNLILGIPSPDSPAARAHSSAQPSRPSRPRVPSGAPLSGGGGRSVDEILQAREKHLGPNLSVAYRRPLKMVRGLGQFLFDHQGQAYLDCVNNVPHVGHSHPRVVEAGRRQMALLNTNTRYLHDLLVDYAERLLKTLPEPLSVVYFVCTGSEANELALRMARAHTGRQDVLVVEGAYHGNTNATVDLSPYKFDRAGGQGAPPWVHKVLIPDPYRGRFRTPPTDPGSPQAQNGPGARADVTYMDLSEAGRRYAENVRQVLSNMEAEGRMPAAFFCESLMGCGGQIVPPPGYLSTAFDHVRTAGGVCVADEVQVGFGRVGSHFWAFESQDAIPDIVTLGKPMANGHPVGAVVTTPEIASSFHTGMEYFNTFGGNPVSCAIGMAVLDVLEEEGLQENAREVGGYLLERLTEVRHKHPVVGDVRGIGLFIGVEVVEDPVAREPAPTRAARVKERLRDHRILLSTDGPQDNVLKIKPPLVFTREDADRLVSVLDKVLQEDGIRLPEDLP